MEAKRVAFFVGNQNGLQLLDFGLKQKLTTIKIIYVTESLYHGNSDYFKIVEFENQAKIKIINSIWHEQDLKTLLGIDPHFIFLIYWPFILPTEFLNTFKVPIVNTHLSYLPFNRGKNPNVWPIINDTPAGVSLHLVDCKIDSGAILSRKIVDVDVLDTGKTLHLKLLSALDSLFREIYPSLIMNEVSPVKNETSQSDLNYSQDFYNVKNLSEVLTNDQILLIKILRACTYDDYEPAYYYFEGRKIGLKLQVSELHDE
jgi:methionyl-tRNA formyltransferase